MISKIKECNPKALGIKVNEVILEMKQKQFEDKVKHLYKLTYPDFKEKEIRNVLGDVINIEKEMINYNEYDGVTTDESGIEVKHFINDYKEGHPERPTFEYFKALKEKEYNPNELNADDYSLTPIDISNVTDEFERTQIEELNTFRAQLKESILNKIQEVADLSYNKAKAYLAGKHNLTLDQVERYKTKYQLALKAQGGDNDALSKFDLEAELVGLTTTELVNLIVDLGNNWEQELTNYTTKIEALRVATKKILEADPKRAVHIISVGATFPATVTDAEIKGLFNG